MPKVLSDFRYQLAIKVIPMLSFYIWLFSLLQLDFKNIAHRDNAFPRLNGIHRNTIQFQVNIPDAAKMSWVTRSFLHLPKVDDFA